MKTLITDDILLKYDTFVIWCILMAVCVFIAIMFYCMSFATAPDGTKIVPNSWPLLPIIASYVFTMEILYYWYRDLK